MTNIMKSRYLIMPKPLSNHNKNMLFLHEEEEIYDKLYLNRKKEKIWRNQNDFL